MTWRLETFKKVIFLNYNNLYLIEGFFVESKFFFFICKFFSWIEVFLVERKINFLESERFLCKSKISTESYGLLWKLSVEFVWITYLTIGKIICTRFYSYIHHFINKQQKSLLVVSERISMCRLGLNFDRLTLLRFFSLIRF